MFPGERKMVQYDFSESEIDDLIDFFKWIGEMDLNGFPAQTAYEKQAEQNASFSVTTVQKPANWGICEACHRVNGQGGNTGPALDGVGTRFDRDYLIDWIKDPQSVKPGTAMPALTMSDDDFDAVIEYLTSLK